MVSPSASLTENRLDRVTVLPWVKLLSAVVTTGAVLGGTVTLKGDQRTAGVWLQSAPSKARICTKLSLTEDPATKEVWATWAAVMSITARSGWATPLILHDALPISAVQSHIW